MRLVESVAKVVTSYCLRVPTVHEVQDEAELVRCLKGIVEVHHKRAVHLEVGVWGKGGKGERERERAGVTQDLE